MNAPFIRDQIGFGDFSLHVAPCVVFVMIAVLLYLYKFYRKTLTRKANIHILQTIQIWNNTLKRFNERDEEENKVREYIEKHLKELNEELQIKNDTLDTIDELEKNIPLKI